MYSVILLLFLITPLVDSFITSTDDRNQCELSESIDLEDWNDEEPGEEDDLNLEGICTHESDMHGLSSNAGSPIQDHFLVLYDSICLGLVLPPPKHL